MVGALFMSVSDLKSIICRRALELGFDACGFAGAAPPDSLAHFRDWLAAGAHGEMAWIARGAEKRADLSLVLPGVKSVICLAAAYPHEQPPAGQGRGLVARFARGQDYHEVLAGPLRALTEAVDRLGGTGTRSLWYVDTGPILERDLAQRAGLGFMGKHASLISRTMGNWFFLAEILTTLELPPDAPERNRCGTCARCMAACPTAAITAPFVLDARRCISYLTIELKGSIPVGLRPLVGNRIFGCDDCLAACPWNRFARQSSLMAAQARPELAAPDLLALLALDAAGFKRQFAGTPIERLRRRGLLRNVCVALGNTAGPEALPALTQAAADAEPLIVEHAAWAIEQISRRHPAR
jgi:epoxyqueuosine reductase